MNLWNKVTNNFIRLFLKKPFSSKGRANRTEYIVGLLALLILFYSGNEFYNYFYKSLSLIIIFLKLAYLIIAFLYFFRYFFLVTRRLHDLNISGWWQLITFVPFGQLLVIGLIFFKGTPGPNKYGEPPID